MIHVMFIAACTTGVLLVVAAGLLVLHTRMANDASRRRARHRAERPAATCRCGHLIFAHQHHRAGDDCGLCACASYRKLRVGGRPQNVVQNALEWVQ